jgi:hypothetical protein
MTKVVVLMSMSLDGTLPTRTTERICAYSVRTS